MFTLACRSCKVLRIVKRSSVIRFSVENLLDSGCHILRQSNCAEGLFPKLDLPVSEHAYDNRYITNKIPAIFQPKLCRPYISAAPRGRFLM